MLEKKDLEQIAMLLEKSSERTNEKITGIENTISEMKEEISDMKKDILDLRLTIENETNRNIKIIAEGHMDLSRKYSDVQVRRAEEEVTLVRLNILAEDVRKIKRKLECMA